MTTEQGWTREKEHGSPRLVRLIIWLTLRLGWPVGQALLVPITAYFFVTLSHARTWSRHYLGRVLGRRPTVGDVWRHFFTFACVTLDRICFLANRTERFCIAVHGLHSLEAALAPGRGCILLGSHLGSFEVLRAFGRRSPVPVRPLMYRGTTAALSTFMEALDPAIRQDVIEIGTPITMLRVRESLARGEIVGILADRAPPGAQRFASAEFLGLPARFPTGPLALAAALQVPVVLFFGLRRGPRDYQVIIEPFADRIVPDPGPRMAALRRWTERYAARLAEHCRKYPYNWFNFYDFWEQQRDVAATTDPADAFFIGERPSRRPVAATPTD
ncbi:MAG: lipid A biosynthesis acyltransferase [Alphaproteobacteria bacterium]|nr:lipid A biosynthesis acyltransferase [Alphaproteobacteria bacterium]